MKIRQKIETNTTQQIFFSSLIEKNGYIVELPKESFKKSGTLINTVIVVIDKNE